MEDCIFCKIIAGDMPSHTVASDDHYTAFLDIRPVTAGHTLVVPKTHHDDFLSFQQAEGAEAISFIQEVARKVMAATGCDAFNLWVNNGRAAGQLVDHLHFHIVPRKKGDFSLCVPKLEPGDDELAEMAEKISNA